VRRWLTAKMLSNYQPFCDDVQRIFLLVKVRVLALPPYVKTAEPMPMLRPPDVIHIGEEV
jgi:hypothetical protein